jgi:hypothetical protein
MITKAQLKQMKDSNNHVKHSFEVSWEETSLSRLFDKIDASVEGGALIDIVSAKPIEFIKEREALIVEIVMDVSDVFDGAEEVED